MNNGKYFNEEIIAKLIEEIKGGEFVKKACEIAGIGESTFYRWMQENEEFRERIKTAKKDGELLRIEKLEASIYKRATGYDARDRRSELMPNPNGGNPIITRQTLIEKHIPADVGAAIFLLTNLSPEKWKNKLNTEHSGEVGTGLKLVIEGNEDKELIEEVFKSKYKREAD